MIKKITIILLFLVFTFMGVCLAGILTGAYDANVQFMVVSSGFLINASIGLWSLAFGTQHRLDADAILRCVPVICDEKIDEYHKIMKGKKNEG